MKIICDCGNEFDFDKKEGSTMEGFEFVMFENDDKLALHCNKCDKAIVLSDPEEVDD